MVFDEALVLLKSPRTLMQSAHPLREGWVVAALRDNNRMAERDPRFEHMRHYMPGQRPCVQITGPDLGKFHARIIGWIPGEVFVEYPLKIIDYVTAGQLDVMWVPTAAAVRIRRADSIWLSTEDDHNWHQT